MFFEHENKESDNSFKWVSFMSFVDSGNKKKILKKRYPNNPTVAHRQDKFVEPNILITKLTQRYLAWGGMLR